MGSRVKLFYRTDSFCDLFNQLTQTRQFFFQIIERLRFRTFGKLPVHVLVNGLAIFIIMRTEMCSIHINVSQ